jgi:tetratricopeptide (TPR) repeat protein
VKAIFESLLIATLVSAAFWPSLAGEFVWDDVAYLLQPRQARELSVDSLLWAFSMDAAIAGHYQPLTWLSWMVDFQLADGAHARQFHLTNVLLHAMHTVVLLALFRALLGPLAQGRGRSIVLLGVLLYALHPLRVESVAWITERRDVLCGVFFSGALLAYVRATDVGNSSRLRGLAFALFVISLLCKAWAITFPAVLFAVDFLLNKGGEGTRRLDLASFMKWSLERWHYIACSIGFAVIGLFAAVQSGAVVPVETLPLAYRALQASEAWWSYLLMTLWPMGLSPYYGWQTPGAVSIRAVVAILACVLVGLAAVRCVSRGPALSATILVYSAVVFPVLGFVQSGPQALADRYTYLAMVPWHILLTGVVAGVSAKSLWAYRLAVGAGIVLIVLLSVLSRQQSLVWRDSLTLWSRAVEVSPADLVARHTRAMHAASAGDFALALSDLEFARETAPHSPAPQLGIARVKLMQGQPQQALASLDSLSETDSASTDAVSVRSQALLLLGQDELALVELKRGLGTSPQDAGLWWAIGTLHSDRKEAPEALEALSMAAALSPRNADIFLQRAALFAQLGRLAEAKGDIRQALHVSPADWSGQDDALRWLEQLSAVLPESSP